MKEEIKGIVCQKCEGQLFDVVWTRPRAKGEIARCRQCRFCGHRMITTEVIKQEKLQMRNSNP